MPLTMQWSLLQLPQKIILSGLHKYNPLDHYPHMMGFLFHCSLIDHP